jgi:hypothetical protein
LYCTYDELTRTRKIKVIAYRHTLQLLGGKRERREGRGEERGDDQREKKRKEKKKGHTT